MGLPTLRLSRHIVNTFSKKGDFNLNYKQSLCCVNCVLGTVGLDKHNPYLSWDLWGPYPRMGEGDRC